MQLDFRQGIISYPIVSNTQTFLTEANSYVSLNTTQGNTIITFAYGTENFIIDETENVSNVWGPLQSNTNYWLYWDINPITATRTFGFTPKAPVFGPTKPTDNYLLHWFNTTTNKMYVYDVGGWKEVIRVFAAKVYNNIFTKLGTNTTKPFAGTQVGLNITNTSGQIITDINGRAIKHKSNLFFTTKDDFYTNGSPTTAIRIENQIIKAIAQEHINKNVIVKFTQFGYINIANYNDLHTTTIAITTENLLNNQIGAICLQGTIINPNWNFQTVGAPLWVSENGILTDIDPWLSNSTNYPREKKPIGIVLTSISIYLNPTMNMIGADGTTATPISLATTTIFGISKLSIPAEDILNPIAVGDNDPRLIPYNHPVTHPATMISTNGYNFLTDANLQLQLHQLIDRPLDSLSDVSVPSPAVNNILKWNGLNWINSSFVGVTYLRDLSDVQITSPTTNQLLKYNGTKWVNYTPSIITLQNDVSGTGYPVISTTLATVNANVGTYGSSLQIPSITVNGKGLTTAVTLNNIILPESNVSTSFLWACGRNQQDETGISHFLGNNSNINQSSLVQIGTSSWKQVFNANFSTLAINMNGTLWGWGNNNYYQLGDNTNVDNSIPVQIGLKTDWVKVCCSDDHALAIDTNGDLFGWGTYTGGTSGTWQQRIPTFIRITGGDLNPRTQNITCGLGTSFVIDENGTLWGWGENDTGQLGIGNTFPAHSLPVQVSSLTTWKQISSIHKTTLAIQTDGTLWGWGDNSNWACGYVSSQISSPIQIGSSTDWKQVSSNDQIFAAVTTNGTLWTWGNSTILGNDPIYSPAQMGSLTDWAYVSCGIGMVCAIKTDGTLWAWGGNNYGQLGDGPNIDKSSPVQIGSLTNWKNAVCGTDQLFAIDGRHNPITSADFIGSTTGLTTTGGPITDAGVVTLSGTLNIAHGGTSANIANDAFNNLAPSQLSFNGDFLQTDGTNTHWAPVLPPPEVYAWGDGNWGQLGINPVINIVSIPTIVNFSTNWQQLSPGTRLFGMINNDGTLWMCGQNLNGELGDGTTINKSLPVQVGSLNDWRLVSCGYFDTYAIKQNGTLWAWGKNNYGTSGVGDITRRSSPIQVGSLTDWKYITGGQDFTIAIKNNGTLWTWGYNGNGELGDGTAGINAHKSSPIQVGSLTDWAQIACGYGNTSAIKTDGTLWSWGANYHGQLGDGTNIAKSSPVQIGSLTNWKQIAVGYFHAAAIKTDGTLWTWGFNSYGALGDGTTNWRSSPTQVGSLTSWKHIAVGYHVMGGIQTNGTLWMWGFNNNGGLGESGEYGTPHHESSPVQIGALTNWTDLKIGTFNKYGVTSKLGNSIPIISGGTGQSTQLSALKALMPTYNGPDKMVLTTDGNNAYWALLSTLS